MGKIARTGYNFIFLIIVIGTMWGSAGAQDSARLCDEQVQSASRKSIIIARSEGMENLESNQESSWIPSFIEAFLHFRLGAVRELAIVPPEFLANQLSVAGSEGNALPSEQGLPKYSSVAKQMNAFYLLYPEFKPAKGKKTVRLALDLILVENGTTDTFAINISTENLTETIGASLDSCVNKMLLGGTISLQQQETKLLGMNVVGPGKNAKTIGIALASIKTLKGKEHENVAQDLKKLVNQDPNAYLAYFAGAQEFNKASRYKDAALLLRDLIMKIGPNYPALYPLAARNSRLAEENEDALQVVNMAQGMKLTTDALLLEKALVFEALEQSVKAEKAFHDVLACDPTNYEALLFLTKKYNKDNRSYEALAMAKQITSSYPNQGVGFLEMGKCLIGLKQTAEAEKALERAVELLPNDGIAQMLMGDLSAEKRDYNRAFDYYDRAIKLIPQNADVHVKAAQTCMALGNISGALEILKKVEKQFYDNPGLLKTKGLAEYRLGDTLKAQRDFNRFCENGGRDAEVFTLLGSINENKGELVKAREFYEKAQLMDPENSELQEKLTGVTVKIKLAEESPDAKGSRGQGKVQSGKGHGRIIFQIGSGTLCLGSMVAGFLIDRDLARQYDIYKNTDYKKTKSVPEIQSLHTKIKNNTLYRNVLYGSSVVFGLSCSVTFLIPSKK